MTIAPDHVRPTSYPQPRSPERARCTSELLAAAAGTDDQARKQALWDEAVTINLRVARALARRYAGRGIDPDDLEQVACEGLVKAVRRFDPAQDNEFLSFAVPTIRGEVQRHFRDLGWMVRPTRRVQETQWRSARAEEELTAMLGRPPRPQELVEALDISPAELAEATSANGCFRPTSLDQPLLSAGEGPGLGELLPVEDAALPAWEARATVFPAVRQLAERERRVVYLRFFEELTQEEIAIEIGVGQAQVSRILNRVLGELRDRLTGAQADVAS